MNKQRLQLWTRSTISATVSRRKYATAKTTGDEESLDSVPRKIRSQPPDPDHVLCGSILARVQPDEIVRNDASV